MHSFQLLTRASGAILILILCLQLGTNNAQENDQETIKMDMSFPDTVKENELVSIKLHLETELKECMVVKTQLKSSYPTETSFNLIQTVCLCNDYPRNLYWDFFANSSMYIIAKVNAIDELGICPGDKAVVPIVGKQNIMWKQITVTDDEWSPSNPSNGLSPKDT